MTAAGNNRIAPTAAAAAPPLALRLLWAGTLLLAAGLLLFRTGTGAAAPAYEPADAGNSAAAPDWQPATWLTGVYQEGVEKHLKEQGRIARALIPLKNQLDYALFRKLSLNDYLIGKHDQLLSAGALDAYYGRDYIGDTAAAEKMRRVRVLQDTLRRKGIDLVLLFVPTKEQLYPEHIPDAYRRYHRGKSNLDAYTGACQRLGINHINFLPFYEARKRTTRYPLYPQYGSHWSYYAECLAADTVIRYIERLKGHGLPRITWQKIDYPRAPAVRDADAINKCGLLAPPRGTPMAYPEVAYQTDPGARAVKTLGIGDSYYRGFAYLGTMEHAFGNGEYWYYYNSVVPERQPAREVWEYDLKSKIEENRVILVLSNNAALGQIGHGFLEDAYELYTSPATYHRRAAQERRFKAARKRVHQDPELLEEALARASSRNISLDSAINQMARTPDAEEE